MRTLLAAARWCAAILLVLGLWGVAQADEVDVPCGTPLPTFEAVAECLAATVDNPGPWAVVAKGSTAAAKLIRAGNPQGTYVFVVAKRDGGWAAVEQVAHEQGHGRRSTTLSATNGSETTIAGRTVVRFDIRVDDEVFVGSAASGDNEPETQDSYTMVDTRAVFCVVGGACAIVRTGCKAERRYEETGKPSKSQKGRFTGRATLTDDGTIKVDVTGRNRASATVCGEPPERTPLWSASPPRLTPPPVTCVVTAEKSHFRDALEGTPLRAYVQEGDRVDVTRPDWDEQGLHLVARFRGPKQTTVGILDSKTLSCPEIPVVQRAR